MRGSESSWQRLRGGDGHARLYAGVALAMAALARATPARACPKCAEGVTARAEVWSVDFGFHLIAMLLPLCIIGVLAFAAEKLASGRLRALNQPRSAEGARSVPPPRASRWEKPT